MIPHRIKLAKPDNDEPNLNFFERHPKKILAAGGVLGGLALHRLLKSRSTAAGTPKPNTRGSGGSYGGGGAAPSRSPRQPPAPRHEAPAEAPKIVSTPKAEAPKTVPAPKHEPPASRADEAARHALHGHAQAVSPGPRREVDMRPPPVETPKIKGVKKGTRAERLAARAAEDAKKAQEGTVPEDIMKNVTGPWTKTEGGVKLASIRDFALFASLVG